MAGIRENGEWWMYWQRINDWEYINNNIIIHTYTWISWVTDEKASMGDHVLVDILVIKYGKYCEYIKRGVTAGK